MNRCPKMSTAPEHKAKKQTTNLKTVGNLMNACTCQQNALSRKKDNRKTKKVMGKKMVSHGVPGKRKTKRGDQPRPRGNPK